VHVELPAVIDTAQAALLVAAEEQPRPAVRAAGVNDADLAIRVAEGHEVFTEHAQAHWRAIRLRQFLGQQHWVPEAADQLAHGRTRAGSRQEFVVAKIEHSTPPTSQIGFRGTDPRLCKVLPMMTDSADPQNATVYPMLRTSVCIRLATWLS
jgi:hypothetical protein